MKVIDHMNLLPLLSHYSVSFIHQNPLVFARVLNRACFSLLQGPGLNTLPTMENQGTLGLERLSLGVAEGNAEHVQKRNPNRNFRKKARARNAQLADAGNNEQGRSPIKAQVSPSGEQIYSPQDQNPEPDTMKQKPVDQLQKKKKRSRRKPSTGQGVLAKAEPLSHLDRVESISKPRLLSESSKKGQKALNRAKDLDVFANQESFVALQPDEHGIPCVLISPITTLLKADPWTFRHSDGRPDTIEASFSNRHDLQFMSSPLQPALREDPKSLPASAGRISKAKTTARQPMIHLPAPEPTPAYLQQTTQSSAKLLQPQRLLVILDLNGTLLYRQPKSSTYTPRPFLTSFLDYCFENHAVLIWSSARPSTVRHICATLFTPTQQSLCLGQWARDTFGLTPTQYIQRVQVYKHLDRVWQNSVIQEAHPDAAAVKDAKTKDKDDKSISGATTKGQGWGQHNTVLIDDSVIKASAQPFNLLEVPEYVKGGVETIREESGGITGDEPADAVLDQVTELLKEACMYDDISRFFFRLRAEGRRGIVLPRD